MIQTLGPDPSRDALSLADFSVGHDLSWIGASRIFRVMGWSMFPALRKGDVLRLAPPEPVGVGDLVLFRLGRALACHRVISMRGADTVQTRGDDTTGSGELVRRAELVGKVSEIVRGRTSIDPRAPQAATGFARIARSGRSRAAALTERVAQGASRLLRALLHSRPVRPVAARILRRSLSCAVGLPAPLRLVRAYRFVELGRPPIDPVAAGAAIRSLPSLRQAIVLARLGTVPLGTIAVGSGGVQIRRAVAGLGIEDALRALVAELVALEVARGG